MDTLFKKGKASKGVKKDVPKEEVKEEKVIKIAAPKKVKKPVKPVKVEKDKIRSRTEEGYLVYTEAELNMGKGGETEDCPFDC